MENFENDISELKTDFHMVTSSLSYGDWMSTPRGNASLEYNRFGDYVNYYNRYKTEVYEFQTVVKRFNLAQDHYESEKIR